MKGAPSFLLDVGSPDLPIKVFLRQFEQDAGQRIAAQDIGVEDGRKLTRPLRSETEFAIKCS